MKERVFTVIGQVLALPVDQLNEELSMETSEQWDSLKHMSIVISLEQEFGVKFKDEQVMTMLSVKEILSVLSMLVA